MIAAGIDVGGTKIEAQVFGADWQCLARQRVDTPRAYPALVAAMAAQIGWAEAQMGVGKPVGIAAAGLVNRGTGLALTANLCAMGRPFPADIAALAGRGVTYLNDCRAFALSEALFGAARGHDSVVGLILGTGIGGGVVVRGHLLAGMGGFGGEFGHFSLAAAPVLAHGLPVLRCGCGRLGCSETLISGPGLSRIALALTGRALTPEDIGQNRRTEPDLASVWAAWCGLVAEVMLTLCLTIDPDCIVLGGGLSKIAGLVPDLDTALRAAQLPGLAVPEILLAEGGDASGARGAAYAAWQEAGHG